MEFKPYYSIEIESDETDDTGYIDIVYKITKELSSDKEIKDVSIVRIKNWFDHKWLNYSGKGIVHTEETRNPNKVALDNFWKKKLTIPPFTPNRVLSEYYFRRKGTQNKLMESELHIWQSSTSNLQRRIQDRTRNGLFIWFSSNSRINRIGSIMIYCVINDETISWYASIEDKYGWIISQTKNINIDEVNKMIK